ncbi:glutathione S-transferase [Naegleria gruberi]|uniref:Glutathione S-transferase n=1 Tax=Naegleria gruberi TaxID=5762 RepID=D2VFE1_NAEGR|nr:glutathione S-transferase [Naegleria gruberi]EFC44445.1 glutathione S-transferase [Naegleria gruberi]|eukprot:XP_002677189.1 glutathione S-transferase [Naegleria gruberi strain NEG-M]
MVIQVYRYIVSAKTNPSLHAVGWRCRLQLEEKDLGYDNILVINDPSSNDQFNQHSLNPTINPKKELPVLEDGGAIIVEEGAIMQYLETTYADQFNTLMPDFENDRGKYAEVLSLYHEALNAYNFSKDIIDALIKDQQDVIKSKEFKIRVQQWKKKMRDELKHWNEYLSQKDYLWPLVGGKRLSLADCAFYPLLAILMRYGFDIKGFDNLQNYYQRVTKRDSVTKSKPSKWDSDLIEQWLADK